MSSTDFTPLNCDRRRFFDFQDWISRVFNLAESYVHRIKFAAEINDMSIIQDEGVRYFLGQ